MNQFETDLSASVNGTPTVEKILYQRDNVAEFTAVFSLQLIDESDISCLKAKNWLSNMTQIIFTK